MQEIRCPNCGKVFQVDEAGYARIVQQVRDREFSRELERREQELVQQKENDMTIALMEHEKSHGEAIIKKNEELAGKDREIERLKAQLERAESERKLAVSEAVREKDRELSQQMTAITELKGELTNRETERQLREKSLKEQYEGRLKLKDEQIEYYKDFKARQSTKMVGESLEQHCLTQFNSIRMTAFPHAVFEKDNEVKEGTKGDFVFRDYDDDKTEYISIMFEMKNEMSETVTKHKNEDFFKKLDKDRREKKCEYAVLVSLLELDNELYNNGIVDVSYRYEKMYVVRPQFFIPIISLLSNAAKGSLEYRRKLQLAERQNIDVEEFNRELFDFKDKFSRNYRLASEKFQKAIDEINKTIDHLQKTKDALLSSENQLRLANSKAEDLSIKRLTKNAPSVRAMFEAADDGN